jgi:GntR family transcriptional regulator / MocR family aminotransferase
MSKRPGAFELPLPPRMPGTPAYRWLYTTLRQSVLEGRLKPGTRIPSTRDMARQYGLSRGTIVATFEQLASEGYFEGSAGSGTFVSKVLPEDLLEAGRQASERSAAPQESRRQISRYAKRVKLFRGFEQKPSRAFRANVPALDFFPTTLWAQLASRILRRAPVGLLLGCDPMGYMPLRGAVADYLKTSRGVNCEAGQIAIVSGVQEALELAARLLVDPGQRVCMEDPGYIGAAMVFDGMGARISALTLDGEGMRLQKEKMRGARMIYITPAHQFPLGIAMSLPRRLELLEWARRSAAVIFEDDYDSEFRYSGRPVPAMQGLGKGGTVLFAGSFSKVLFPSLRLGYLVIPQDLVPYFEAAQSVTRRHASLIDQAILREFIAEGHFGRHLRRMREVYAERQSVLFDSAREWLGGLLEISGLEAGLQTVGWLGCGIREEQAVKAAAERNVEVVPVGWFARSRFDRQGLQLGFAAVDRQEIRRGARELATALEKVQKTRGRAN